MTRGSRLCICMLKGIYLMIFLLLVNIATIEFNNCVVMKPRSLVTLVIDEWVQSKVGQSVWQFSSVLVLLVQYRLMFFWDKSPCCQKERERKLGLCLFSPPWIFPATAQARRRTEAGRLRSDSAVDRWSVKRAPPLSAAWPSWWPESDAEQKQSRPPAASGSELRKEKATKSSLLFYGLGKVVRKNQDSAQLKAVKAAGGHWLHWNTGL